MYNDEHVHYLYGDQDVQVPAHLNFGKYLFDRLKRRKDEVALLNAQTGERLTYREFTEYSVKAAMALRGLGVRGGDVVALGCEKRIYFVPTVVSVLLAGATYTPYDLKSGRAVLKHKIGITKPKYFICSKLFWETYSDILEACDSVKTFIALDDEPKSLINITKLMPKNVNVDNFEPVQVKGQTDTAFILYSSGTTGMPKGVQLSHLNCILNSLPHEFADKSLETAYLFGEWYHNYDTFMTYKFISLGRKMVFVDDVTNEAFLKCIEDHKVNIAWVIPSFVGYLSKIENASERKLDSLKIIYSRSAPLHRKTIEGVKQRFPKLKDVLQGYGMTECGEPSSEAWGSKGPKSGSVGMASPGITIKIVDPTTRQVLKEREQGEICLRGPILMKGYIGMDPATYLDEDGFFKTGDLGYYDEDRYLYIVGRMKEIITYDGFKIAPLELETILQLHPAVREAAVIGRPVGFEEYPTAFVVKQPGLSVTEQELLDFVVDEVPPYMQLRGGVKFISEIPRNPRGKIMRQNLKEML